MSLLREASFVREQISPFITNTNIDINIIKDDIIATRNAVIFEYNKKQLLTNPEQLYTEVTCIPLECKDISECCDIDSDEKVLVATIPQVMNLDTIPPIRYVGTIDRLTPFNVVHGITYLYRSYAKWTSKMKAVWYRKSKNQLVFMNNTFSIPPKYITIEFIPQDEQELLQYECACIDTDDVEYRCPDYLVEVVRNKVIQKWMPQVNIPHNHPNTQSEIIAKKI